MYIYARAELLHHGTRVSQNYRCKLNVFQNISIREQAQNYKKEMKRPKSKRFFFFEKGLRSKVQQPSPHFEKYVYLCGVEKSSLPKHD
jgi:hypothetical protein